MAKINILGFNGCVIIIGLSVRHQGMVNTVFLVFCFQLTNVHRVVIAPLTNFARAATTFSEHAKQLIHLKSVATLAEVKYRFRHSAPSVDQQLSFNASYTIKLN